MDQMIENEYTWFFSFTEILNNKIVTNISRNEHTIAIHTYSYLVL